jgi:hypothetical protein
LSKQDAQDPVLPSNSTPRMPVFAMATRIHRARQDPDLKVGP